MRTCPCKGTERTHLKHGPQIRSPHGVCHTGRISRRRHEQQNSSHGAANARSVAIPLSSWRVPTDSGNSLCRRPTSVYIRGFTIFSLKPTNGSHVTYVTKERSLSHTVSYAGIIKFPNALTICQKAMSGQPKPLWESDLHPVGQHYYAGIADNAEELMDEHKVATQGSFGPRTFTKQEHDFNIAPVLAKKTTIPMKLLHLRCNWHLL